MPNSLKTKINNLRFRNRITEEEHKTLIRKLQGHDQELYARAYSAGLKDGMDITLDATCDVMFKILEEVSGSDR